MPKNPPQKGQNAKQINKNVKKNVFGLPFQLMTLNIQIKT